MTRPVRVFAAPCLDPRRSPCQRRTSHLPPSFTSTTLPAVGCQARLRPRVHLRAGLAPTAGRDRPLAPAARRGALHQACARLGQRVLADQLGPRDGWAAHPRVVEPLVSRVMEGGRGWVGAAAAAHGRSPCLRHTCMCGGTRGVWRAGLIPHARSLSPLHRPAQHMCVAQKIPWCLGWVGGWRARGGARPG